MASDKCFKVRIPQILSLDIRTDKELKNAFKNAKKLSKEQIEIVSDDFYNTLKIEDPLLKNFIKESIENINKNTNMFTNAADKKQCETAIGPERSTDKCYLCGFPLLERGQLGVKNTTHPLYPECEHVLPYILGALYLNLVTGKKEFERLPVDSQELTKAEYRWSHRCCNQFYGRKKY